MRPNLECVIPGRGCACGVVGFVLSILPDRPTVRNHAVSRSGLGWPVVEGDTPVDVRQWLSSVIPSSTGPLKSCANLAGPPAKPKYYLLTDSGLVP